MIQPQQFSLFELQKKPLIQETLQTDANHPSTGPALPPSDMRQALDAHEAAQQAVMLLRGLGHFTLKQANLSQKNKLIQILNAEARLKNGSLPAKLSIRQAYMVCLKGSC